MEGINNATRRQIVINFYQKNQAKGKPYTIEYFRTLNVSHQQVYRAIKRYESGISHKQQLGAGRPRILTLCHFPLTNDWPTADQRLTNGWPILCHFWSIIMAQILFVGHFLLLIYPSLTYLLILWNFNKYLYIYACFSFVFQMLYQ